MQEASGEPAPELPVGPVLAASLTGLRSELSGMRDDIAALHSLRADDSVEGRLAAIEDTLEGLGERLEAVARDSATEAGERIASLDDRLAALSQSVSAERTASAQHRERTSLAMQDQAAALDEWAEAVRAGLEDLGEAVTGSLGSLGTTLQNPASRDADRRHLEALVTELTTTIDEAFAGMGEQIAIAHQPIHDKLAYVHEDVLDGFGGARARLIEELSGTIEALERANHATRQVVEAELVELRGDLADALEEVREHVEGTVNEANTSIAATLEEHRAASEDLREGIGAAATHSLDAGKRIRGLQDSVLRLDSTLADLQADWRPRVDAVVAEGRASAQSVLEAVQAEIDKAMSEMSETLAAQVKTVRGVTGSLGGSSERLIAAGEALLAYLGDRDRWLERERDRVLHEMLDEFAAGLSAKERKAVASRVGEAIDRRRDARDAARYRRTTEGLPAVEIPPVPAELAELDKPVVPVTPTARRARPAAGATRAPSAAKAQTSTPSTPSGAGTATKSAARTATKRTSKSTTKAAPRTTSPKPPARAASTAKTASKSTKKTTTKATPTKRSTS